MAQPNREPGIQPATLTRLKSIVGPDGWISSAEDLAPHLREERGLYRGATPLLLRPASTDEVAAIVTECADARIALVPQGGNTGLVGGQIPSPEGDQIIVNLARMNRIRDLDTTAGTITVEAGCVLAAVQEAAADADRLFPLSLGAEGTCQIGGNLATNAGGVQVLRYGTARALTLGLEVVMADGRVWDGLRGLIKDNTGYDLKSLFIGSEGTLGIITAAVLRLFPRPWQTVTTLAGIADIDRAVDLMGRMQEATGQRATAFEVMSDFCVELSCKHIGGAVRPLAQSSPWYALMEFHGGAGDDLEDAVQAGLAGAIEDAVVTDAVVAQNAGQATALWRLRESLPEAQTREGASIKHDIGVPAARAAAMIRASEVAVAAEVPGTRMAVFGHLGDGNLHLNLSQPTGMDRDAFLAHWPRFNRMIHEIAVTFGGTFSAEHGVGQLKRDELARHRPAVELDAMRGIKAALDPHNLFNPGKML